MTDHFPHPERDLETFYCGRCGCWFEDWSYAAPGWCPVCDTHAGPLTSEHIPPAGDA